MDTQTTDRRTEGQKNRAVSVHTNLVIISFLASSASLCAAEAEMFPGTPTVHSTYRKGLCMIYRSKYSDEEEKNDNLLIFVFVLISG